MGIFALSKKPLDQLLNRQQRYRQSHETLIYEHELRDDLEHTREEIVKSQRLGIFGLGWVLGLAMGVWMAA